MGTGAERTSVSKGPGVQISDGLQIRCAARILFGREPNGVLNSLDR